MTLYLISIFAFLLASSRVRACLPRCERPKENDRRYNASDNYLGGAKRSESHSFERRQLGARNLARIGRRMRNNRSIEFSAFRWHFRENQAVEESNGKIYAVAYARLNHLITLIARGINAPCARAKSYVRYISHTDVSPNDILTAKLYTTLVSALNTRETRTAPSATRQRRWRVEQVGGR